MEIKKLPPSHPASFLHPSSSSLRSQDFYPFSPSLPDLTANPPDLAVCAVVAAHVDQAEDGEGDRNGDQDVVYDGSDVQAGFLVNSSRFFVCIKRLELYQSMGMKQKSIDPILDFQTSQMLLIIKVLFKFKFC